MVGAAIQRFSILLLLFGGFLDIYAAIEFPSGLPALGRGIMLLALVLGIVGLSIELSSNLGET